jgi:hypothetical protein
MTSAQPIRDESMRDDDARYHSRRALEEEEAARKAVCEAARHRHQELAMTYRYRAGTVMECTAEASAKEPEG